MVQVSSQKAMAHFNSGKFNQFELLTSSTPARNLAKDEFSWNMLTIHAWAMIRFHEVQKNSHRKIQYILNKKRNAFSSKEKMMIQFKRNGKKNHVSLISFALEIVFVVVFFWSLFYGTETLLMDLWVERTN